LQIGVEQEINTETSKFDLNSSMKKNLKSQEVLDSLSKKVELKIALRDAKKSNDDKKVESLSKKIGQIESKLSSTPLQKI
jgi:hypothetical protein